MKFSWEGYNKIVSNSPYSLAEPIIKKAVEANVEELILIVGEKFKDVVLENKSKAGVVTNLFFDFKPIIKIKKKVLALCQELIPAWSDCREKKIIKRRKSSPGHCSKKGKIKNAIISSLVSEGKTKNQSRDLMKKMNFHDDVFKQTCWKPYWEGFGTNKKWLEGFWLGVSFK